MSELDKLLAPIAGSNPCGVDLEYDSRFQSLKAMVETGTKENPTDWKKVKKQCLELLNDGRSVELLVLLAVSMVATEGFLGLHDGIYLLTKSVEDFWDTIYPELDMDEPEAERFEIRLNSIAQLGEKPGKLGDTICFVEKILKAPLSVDNPRVSACYWPVWESEVSEGEEASDEANSALAHIKQMSYEDSKLFAECITKTIKRLSDFNQYLMEKTGAGYNAPFDDSLLPILNLINSKFKVDVQMQDEEDVPSSEEISAAVGQQASAAAPVMPPPGTINTREDVKEALGKIIEYYRDNEPSSPVPYLILRTQELIDSDFMDVVRNLVKETEPQFKRVLNIN